jgi:aldehyde dehydrogenase (NAD+)
MQITNLLDQQRAYFNSGATLNADFRLRQLGKLRDALRKNENAIYDAVYADLRKPRAEAYVSEIGLLLSEIRGAMDNLREWMSPQSANVSLPMQPSVALYRSAPYGVALILGAWNYPIQLVGAPLIGAICAGNCAILKPSEVAPHSSALLAKLVADTFEPRYIATVEGGADVAQELLAQRFDTIFYTGNPNIAKIVAVAAAKNLTPTTLELGGKSPVIVLPDANIKHAAQHIIGAKTWNAGQTCIAPDYLLVHRSIKGKLFEAMREQVRVMFGDDPQRSDSYARIVNDKHFRRVSSMMSDGCVTLGGKTDEQDLYIAPTIIEDAPAESRLLQEEIFGPLLPLVQFDSLDDAVSFVQVRPNPLSAYFFTNNRKTQEELLRRVPFGNGAFNGCMEQFATEMPFGGIGNSGMGSYHGKRSFDAFSRQTSVIYKSRLATDVLARFAPFNSTKLRLLKLFLR